MENYYKVVWTPSALDGFENIFLYIENKFSHNDAIKFANKFSETLNFIKKNPGSFPIIIKSKKYRRVLVAKLTSILFIIEDEIIYIIDVFDNRRNYFL